MNKVLSIYLFSHNVRIKVILFVEHINGHYTLTSYAYYAYLSVDDFYKDQEWKVKCLLLQLVKSLHIENHTFSDAQTDSICHLHTRNFKT